MCTCTVGVFVCVYVLYVCLYVCMFCISLCRWITVPDWAPWGGVVSGCGWVVCACVCVGVCVCGCVCVCVSVCVCVCVVVCCGCLEGGRAYCASAHSAALLETHTPHTHTHFK